MKNDCSRCADTAAHACGGMTSAEQADFEAHCRVCPACAAESRALGAVVRRLRAAAEPNDDAVLVFRGIPRRRVSVAAVAASLAVLVLGGVWLLRSLPRTAEPQGDGSAALDARDWLAAQQGADGLWDAERWGGLPRYRIGIAGLGALALAGDGSRHAVSARRAAAALLSAQFPNGALAPADGDATLYNHAIALSALLRLYAQGTLTQADEPALRRAVDFTRARQASDGGWGYGDGNAPGDPPNMGVTVWQIEALSLAYALGWGDPEAHLRRGILWMQRQIDDRGQFAYRRGGDAPSVDTSTITAMGVHGLRSATRQLEADAGVRRAIDRAEDALRGMAEPTERPDYYRDFFLLNALAASGEGAGTQAARRRLLAGRHGGDDGLHGSWDPADAWSRAGGRIYATAMAVLALSI